MTPGLSMRVPSSKFQALLHLSSFLHHEYFRLVYLRYVYHVQCVTTAGGSLGNRSRYANSSTDHPTPQTSRAKFDDMGIPKGLVISNVVVDVLPYTRFGHDFSNDDDLTIETQIILRLPPWHQQRARNKVRVNRLVTQSCISSTRG